MGAYTFQKNSRYKINLGPHTKVYPYFCILIAFFCVLVLLIIHLNA